MKVKYLIILGLIGVLFWPSSWLEAQSGGTQPVFHALGAGARQLGLGGACVAMPFDATTAYWNPAATDYLEQNNFSFFYTNLLGGASYNFIGYVHPTLTIGTFGAVMLRWGIDGIKERLDSPYEIGEVSLVNYEFLFSYGKVILPDHNLSMGMNIKIDYQAWPGLSEKAGDTGVGADLAVFYRPELDGSLKGLAFGLVMQNFFAPKLKPLDESDAFPGIFKLGLAKTFELATTGNQFSLLMDLDKGALNIFKFHLGGEYTYNNTVMIRAGMYNNEGTHFVFGAGARYNRFQLDYSYAALNVADMGSSHRLSFSLNFGKTRSEMLEIAKQLEMERIREEVENQQRLAREQELKERLEEGRRLFNEGDFIKAQIEFSAVLQIDEENEEAKEKLNQAKMKQEEEQDRLLRERIQRENLEKEQAELDQYIREHWEKGIVYYEKGQFEDAIDEWNLILKRDPNYQLAIEFRDRALTDMRNDVKALIRQAENHAANHSYVDAIRLLDKAKSKNLSELKLDDDIDAKIAQYKEALDLEHLYRTGLNYYDNKDYNEAAEMFRKALALDPKNNVIQDFYEKANARATATNDPLPPDLKQKYYKGVNLSTNGQYEEALKIFEEILASQPNNKRVLTTIDKTKEKLENSKRYKN